MKLIIDIPKSIYEYMQTDKYDRHKTEYFEMIIPHLVKDGTPLKEELEEIRKEAYIKSCYLEWDNRGSTYVQLCLLNRIIDNHKKGNKK